MAIYSLGAKVISRGNGRSAVAAAAYRSGSAIELTREGVTWDYSKKLGVEHAEILAPKGAPSWVFDRARLWNEVEESERRRDAQLAREVLVALPIELTSEQQLELARDFIREQFVARGMVADLCIHRDNPENPHAHIMLTMRPVEREGFAAKKDRTWNSKQMLMGWRERWAELANERLHKAGHAVRIDHRSYEAQGIEIEPGVHHGVSRERLADPRSIAQHAMGAQRLRELENIQRRNAEAIIADPAIALQAITHQQAVFTERQLARWLSTHTADREDFESVLRAVYASDELVELAPGRFTSREMHEVEQQLARDGDRLHHARRHEVDERFVEQATAERKASGKPLSDEQRAMVRYVTHDTGDLAIVQGSAGAGKSYGLGAAREAWEAAGYRVIGAALAGKAAEGLEASAGIRSRSLHAWEYRWKKGEEKLTSRDVLVIDEAGMVGSRQLGRVMAEAEAAGAKVVLVGDTRQLQAIEAGAPMRMLAERHGQAQLKEIRRQRDVWQQQASKDLAEGHVPKALDAYEKAGAIIAHKETDQARKAVVQAWADARHESGTQIMLAYRRVDVEQLNLAAREIKRAAGELGHDHLIKTADGPRQLARGDQIYFLRNDNRLGVMNGSLGVIEKIKGQRMQVRLDGGKRVVFDTRDYDAIGLGYAASIHKAQGISVERAYALADTRWNQHLAYVAMTRHKSSLQLHWSQQEFGDQANLHKLLSREQRKDVAVDFERQSKEVQQLGDVIRSRKSKQEPAPPIHRSPPREAAAPPLKARPTRETALPLHQRPALEQAKPKSYDDVMREFVQARRELAQLERRYEKGKASSKDIEQALRRKMALQADLEERKKSRDRGKDGLGR